MPILPELKELKDLRKDLHISQKYIEKNLLIPQATISRIENGIGNPSYITVKKIFNFLENEKLRREKSDKKVIDIMTDKIIWVESKTKVKDTVDLMTIHNVSQIPILEENKNIGSITAKKIQKEIIDNPTLINAEITIIMELPFPEIELSWDIKAISNLLIIYPAVLVKKNNKYIGIITDADLLKIS